MIRVITLVILCTLSAATSGAEPAAIYKGGWSSTTTGHKGPMRVKITPRSDGQYDARFTGRFAVVIPFTYKVTMQATEYGPNHKTLVANKRLPIFGNYRMTATVTPCEVNATYRAKKENGKFTMRRSR